MSVVRWRVIVAGTVQGVGFRYSAQRQAERLGLIGHARNLFDGTVEVEMEGPEPDCKQMVSWLAQGPSYASVSKIDVFEQPTSGGRRFEIKH